MKNFIFSGRGICAGSLLFLLLFAGCSSTKNKRADVPRVTFAFNIRTGNSFELNSINLNVYRYRILDLLDDFQEVNFDLVEPDENPELVLDLNIDNFTVWPRNERTSRRTFTRAVPAGTNAQGRPVYQTVSAVVDITQTQIRSNARFITRLTFKGSPPQSFSRTFAPSYTWNHVYVSNVQGDSRAVDPSVYTATSPPIDPTADELLLALSTREMTGRLSDELRRYYHKPVNK